MLLDLGAVLLVVRRQRQRLAERLERLVGREARPDRRDLEQHAARLAEVDRLEVEAVDHRRRLPAALDHLVAPRLVLVDLRRPRDVMHRARGLQPALRPAAGRRRRSRCACRRARPSRPRSRARAAGARCAPAATRTRARRRSRGCGAPPGRRARSRSSGSSPVSSTSSSSPSPSGSSKTSERSRISPPTRFCQKSSDSSEPTRKETRCTIPSPARPRGAPGYSKNVMSAPAEPRSSA